MKKVSKEEKDRFIHQLATYLTKDAAKMSIMLQMNSPEAKTWADLRGSTPVFGWRDIAETEEILTAWLDRW